MNTTKQQIEATCEQLKQALIARLEADIKDTENKLEITRTHNDLLLAKEGVNSIRFN
jgi:hypothetical protein